MSWDFVRFEVSKSHDGLYTATSPELSGVFIAHRELSKIVDDLPNIIKLWFKTNRDQIVEVFQGPIREHDDSLSVQAIPVPAEIAAQALAR